MNRTILISIGLLTLVTACASPEEIRQKEAATCTSYGLKAGTADFERCISAEEKCRHVFIRSYDMAPHGELNSGLGGMYASEKRQECLQREEVFIHGG
jgi:hypothetical protein